MNTIRLEDFQVVKVTQKAVLVDFRYKNNNIEDLEWFPKSVLFLDKNIKEGDVVDQPQGLKTFNKCFKHKYN